MDRREHLATVGTWWREAPAASRARLVLAALAAVAGWSDLVGGAAFSALCWLCASAVVGRRPLRELREKDALAGASVARGAAVPKRAVGKGAAGGALGHAAEKVAKRRAAAGAAASPAVLHGRWRLVGAWRPTPNGAVCRATYRGKRYLVKRLPKRFPGPELARYPRAWLGRARGAWKCLHGELRMRERLEGTPARHLLPGLPPRGLASRANLNVAVDVFCQGRCVYKVTPFVEPARVGGRVLTCANAHELLSPPQLDTLVRSILAQQAQLERCRLVHNDLKPQNVLLTEVAPGVFVGSVIDYDDGFFEGEAPAPDAMVGAVEYASPEVVRYLAHGARRPELAARITCASDMFSLGVLFYELLTGRQLVDASWRWPGELAVRGLTPDLAALDVRHRRVVRAMLHPDPARRPAALEALRALG